MSALSRKKRILDLALHLDKNECSDPTLIKNNNEEYNNIGKCLYFNYESNAFYKWLWCFLHFCKYLKKNTENSVVAVTSDHIILFTINNKKKFLIYLIL